MARLRKLAWLALSLGLWASAASAASFGETKAYATAAKDFQDGTWWRAESGFGQFVEKFPKSEQRPQAVLYQALARFYQTNSAGAITLLTANLDLAGLLADEYQFVIAEAHFQSANFPAAAAAYAELRRRYAVSKRRLEAFVGEATSRSRLGEWTQVVSLLGSSDGEFTRAAQAAPADPFVSRGWLLLGEAQLAQKNYAGVEAAVAPLIGQNPGGVMGWRAEHLRCLARSAEGRLPEALVSSSNLLALATANLGDRKDLVAESVALHAAALERAGQTDQARTVYERNLVAGTPDDRQRQALVKITELALGQGRLLEATNTLVKFLNQFSNAPTADVALLTLGEIQLKQSVASAGTNGAAGETVNPNTLALALGYFDQLVNRFTNSAYVGKAELNRGWCFWLRTNQMMESVAAFARAAELLPDGEDRIVARFKLGDAWFAQKDFARALESYRQAADALPNAPATRATLGGGLYYQMLQASLGVTNVAGAEEAMAQLLKLQPRSDVADRALLLVGQGMADWGDPVQARTKFEEFLALSPNSPRRAEVELVLGRMREQQHDWPGVIAGYEQWLERFATNALRPRAEFQLAWAYFQAGNETNAFSGFTNFIARYATNELELAPQAQWWVADYFWRQNRFQDAEIGYKQVFNKWPNSELAYLARLKAGQAAMGEVRYNEAQNHFTNLTSDVKCPSNIWAQAVFAYGDMLMARASDDKTNSHANYEEAIQVFSKIHQRQPSNEIAVLAWGEMAKCYRQLGSASMSNAVFAFSQVVTSVVVGVSARSEAQVGLAEMLADLAERESGAERVRLLRQALDNLKAVLNGENLLSDKESPDLRWVKIAGLKAGPVLERLGDWEQLEKVYLRLQELLPMLKSTWQLKIEQSRERRAAEKNQPQV